MNRSLATLLVGAAASSFAMAQDLGQSASPVNPSAPTVEAIRQRPFVPDLPFPFSKRQPRTSANERAWIQSITIVAETRIVVRDGAVYYEMLGGTLIPFPGGGASGCFSVDLADRREKLRRTIEAFPPLPSPTPPRQ
ncbi:MAG TPA: hypothetical protein VLM38_18180 [Blastocatellia bacterium]|nr:hypothetical protein [Blastocatellia bacterium]